VKLTTKYFEKFEIMNYFEKSKIEVPPRHGLM
jgi:hypothetical protein